MVIETRITTNLLILLFRFYFCHRFNSFFYGLILQLISFFPWFFRIICCLVNYIWTLRLFQILLHLTLTFITKCNFSMRLVVLGEKYLVSMTYFAIKIRTHEKRIWQHSLSQTKVDNAESFVALRCKVANRIVEE